MEIIYRSYIYAYIYTHIYMYHTYIHALGKSLYLTGLLCELIYRKHAVITVPGSQ